MMGNNFVKLRCDDCDMIIIVFKISFVNIHFCVPYYNAPNKNGSGIILYLRQEGRGIGLINKLKAYGLQDQGYDTYEANEILGFKPDERNYIIAAKILKDLGISHINLLTNNPDKIDQLENNGITIEKRIPLEIPANEVNHDYLETKRDK